MSNHPSTIETDLPPVDPLDAGEVDAHLAAGGLAVDIRHRMSFAGVHIPGSINVELDADFAPTLASVVPHHQPLVLIPPYRQRPAIGKAATRLRRIGFDQVVGYLHGGLDAWRATGRAVSSIPMMRARDVATSIAPAASSPTASLVLDVREPSERDAGHVAGSLPVPSSELSSRLGDIPGDRDLVVVAATGQRASTAASLLARAGRRVRLVAMGGVRDLLDPVRPTGSR